MFERKDIETILRINGVSPTADDAEIRSILLSAKYNNNEVDTALMVLRENVNTSETRLDNMHKILRSDEALSPSEINSLLGITVNIETLKIERKEIKVSRRWQLFTSIILSLLLAASILVLFMYLHRVGPFHVLASAV